MRIFRGAAAAGGSGDRRAGGFAIGMDRLGQREVNDSVERDTIRARGRPHTGRS